MPPTGVWEHVVGSDSTKGRGSSGPCGMSRSYQQVRVGHHRGKPDEDVARGPIVITYDRGHDHIFLLYVQRGLVDLSHLKSGIEPVLSVQAYFVCNT